MSSDALVRPVPEEGDETHDEAPTAQLPLAEGNPNAENLLGGVLAGAAEQHSASRPGGQAGSMLTFPNGATVTTFATDDVTVGIDLAAGPDEHREVMLFRHPDGRVEHLGPRSEAIQSPTSAPTRGGEEGGNDPSDSDETSSGRRDSNPRHQAWELGAEVKKTAFTENLLSQACSGMGELGQGLSVVGWDEGGEDVAGDDPASVAEGAEGEPPSRAPAPPWPWGPARRFRVEGARVIRLADEPAIGGAL